MAAQLILTDPGRALSDFRAELRELLSAFPPLPIMEQDFFSGLTGLRKKVEDTAETMIPLREITHFLNDRLRHTVNPKLKLPNQFQDVRRVTNELTQLVEERHGFEKPDIFRVTPDVVSPAFIQNMIQKEEVHKFKDQKDALTRMTHPLRAIYAWRDRFKPDHALGMIELAFTDGPANNIKRIITAKDFAKNPNTGTAYSISSWKAVDAVGPPLISAVGERIIEENPFIKQIITLSPMKGLQKAIQDSLGFVPNGTLMKHAMAAQYLLSGKNKGNDYILVNAVANFHMHNGAFLSRVCPWADMKAKEALYFMANYWYPSREQRIDNVRKLKASRPVYGPEIQELLHAHAA